jgi:hypothetical protein
MNSEKHIRHGQASGQSVHSQQRTGDGRSENVRRRQQAPATAGAGAEPLTAAAMRLLTPTVYAPTWIPLIRVIIVWVLVVVLVVLLRWPVIDIVTLLHLPSV